ncbi:MAG: hypothetical protein Q7R50_04780 [Dehalococcoidales bacterium]|nr:hypothetical protein [Dehalococcoidales bacterium]
MSRPHHSPIVLLAFPQFQQEFADLLNRNALVTDFSRSLIESIFENVMWFGRTDKDYREFVRTARASYHFLIEGSKTKPKEVAQQYSLIIDNIIPSINSCRLALSEAEDVPVNDPDNKIRKYLASYKVMYEGLFCLICAPVIYAFGIAKRVNNKDFTPDSDGKIDLNTLKVMERLIVYSDNRLARGLNNHIRNAYAHENYKILDDAKVKLWDPNPNRPKKSWGPEVWSLEKLIELNDQVWINALGITCALILYDINNRRAATDRGWFTSKRLPELRREELNDIVDTIADKLGFYMKSLTILGNQVSITLSPQSKGIDQDSDLYMGNKDHTRLYKVKMWYEEKRIIDQVTRMLVTLTMYIKVESEISINIVSHEGVPIGSLSVDLPNIIGLNLTDTDPETVNRIRHIYKIDTIGEITTYVEKKGTPRFAGIAPAMPKPPGIPDIH